MQPGKRFWPGCRRWNVPAYCERAHTGLVRHIYVRTSSDGRALVCVVGSGGVPAHAEDLTKRLRAAVPGLRAVLWNENRSRGNVVLGREFQTLLGDGILEETLCGLRFRLSAGAFFQVNREQAERLYETALSLAGLTADDTVLDLYCGTGTITLCAARQAGKAYGVEVVEAAVADARENAARNGIANAEFFCADAGQAAQRFAGEGIHPDVILVDPAPQGARPGGGGRHGADGPAADRLCFLRSRHPGAGCQAPGRLRLSGQDGPGCGYVPRCAHVETVVLLAKLNTK